MSGYASQGDGELLALFVQRHEEAAFAVVVQRHSVMVWNACRRILGQAQDTEDAAQAVFLALASKAASLSREASVAPWLHRVARCVSLKARQARAARQERERKAAQMRVQDGEAARAWEVLQPLLDAELDALPGKYRRPLILFYLEGRTLEEVAAALRSSVGTVGSWLSRGRELLRDRMVRRGVVLSSVSLAALISQNASAAEVPAALVSATWKAAATVAAEGGIGLVSPQAAGLMKGALQAMFWAKMKLAAAVIAAAMVLGGSAGIGLRKILAREAAQAPAAGEDAVNPRRPVAGPKAEEPVEERRFEGLRALVIEPENYWGWDAAIFGALQERYLDVTYAKADVLEDLAALSRYDLVASNIRRSFTPAQVASLKRFVMEGGAFYASWGGPMGAADLLREVCHVGGSRSVRIAGMSLIENTPLSKGIVEKEIAFPRVVGHLAGGNWEIVSVTPAEGGIPVAKDAAGNVLGVLGQHGKGRTAVLGFGPEQDKYYVKRELGPVMLDNLLGWLLEEKLRTGPNVWPEAVEVSLPARAEVLEVTFNGTRLVNPEVGESGSLKKVKVGVQGVREGEEATIRVTYKPLGQARNVETIIHLPWGSFPRGGPPAKLAEWLKSLKATACQPLLREGDGHAYYKGMPEDTPDPASVTGYKGNFLADFVGECHQRGIKVIGGVYFESRTTLKKHPDAAVAKKDGKRDPKQACFNNPDGQEYNLATIRHLLDNYRLDGVILDDNFELPGYECCCPRCCEGFKAYCARKGIAYAEPSRISGDPMARHWNEYKIEATVELAAKVAKIAHEHNVPAGGWVGASMGAARLKQSFDFLGGMVYTEPPKAASLMHAALGKCRFFTLLWAPSEKPERMEQEVREAVRAGSATVGFWVYPPGHGGGGAMKMIEGSSEAIARAFGKVEEEWLEFYRGHILAGDARFAILDGKVGRQEMTLRVKNVGKKAGRRIQGPLDLEAVRP